MRYYGSTFAPWFPNWSLFASTKYTDVRIDWPARSAGYDWEVALAIAASFDENTLVLGQTFLSTYYTVFDKSNNITSFAPATDACYYGTRQNAKAMKDL